MAVDGDLWGNWYDFVWQEEEKAAKKKAAAAGLGGQEVDAEVDLQAEEEVCRDYTYTHISCTV